MPVRALQMDLPLSEAFSVDSLGKHGFCKCVNIYVWLFDSTKVKNNWDVWSVRFFELFIWFSTAFEIGPQPHGVLRADVFNTMKEAVDLTIEWLQQFNSGRKHHWHLTTCGHQASVVLEQSEFFYTQQLIVFDYTVYVYDFNRLFAKLWSTLLVWFLKGMTKFKVHKTTN